MSAREVELAGGAPWGFRMHGGADLQQPLRISRRYSDSVERMLDVNPGRKAALSGIREGDVITSINGRPTRSMSNADAHAMLKSAGPVLRLGLNEDKEGSPRRRSLGKSGTLELKRPSQLIAEMQSGRATPQSPVYATTRPTQSPLRTPASPFRSPLNAAPASLSTPLVKSANSEEPMRFHPTNPFYSTMPSNNISASRLPVPNGKTLFASLDRSSKPNLSSIPPLFSNNTGAQFSQSQTNFDNIEDSGPSSLPYDSHRFYNSTHNGSAESFQNYRSPFNSTFINSNGHEPTSSDRAETNGTDPFEKYITNKFTTDASPESEWISSPKENIDSEEEIITRRSTITESEVKEYEEVKTVKTIVMNGPEGANSGANGEERAKERKAEDASATGERVASAAASVGAGVATKPPLKSPPATGALAPSAAAHQAPPKRKPRSIISGCTVIGAVRALL